MLQLWDEWQATIHRGIVLGATSKNMNVYTLLIEGPCINSSKDLLIWIAFPCHCFLEGIPEKRGPNSWPPKISTWSGLAHIFSKQWGQHVVAFLGHVCSHTTIHCSINLPQFGCPGPHRQNAGLRSCWCPRITQVWRECNEWPPKCRKELCDVLCARTFGGTRGSANFAKGGNAAFLFCADSGARQCSEMTCFARSGKGRLSHKVGR